MNRRTARWVRLGWRHEAYADAVTGEVLGEVSGGWRTWDAHKSVQGPLGTFLEMEQAKRAVERSILGVTPEGER